MTTNYHGDYHDVVYCVAVGSQLLWQYGTLAVYL